jgi:acyl carrier protein
MPGAPHSTTASSDPCRPDVESRLVKCFAATFADLAPEEIRRADASALPQWDSLASMTLVALVEEEFEVRVNPADLTKLTSFRNTLDYLNSRPIQA